MTGWPLDPTGMWRAAPPSRPAAPAPGLLLDRDGTLVALVDYLSRPEQLSPIPGALASLAQASACGFRVAIVTNQSGIGRGFFDWDAFAAVQARLDDLVTRAGGRIDGVYACPALPGSGALCRKPKPGMLLAAADDLALDPGRSWIVGDSAADIEAGMRAGLAGGWLVPSGYGARDRAAALALAGDSFHVTVDRPIGALGAALANGAMRPKMGSE